MQLIQNARLRRGLTGPALYAILIAALLMTLLAPALARAQDDFSESYTSLDGSLTVRYPAGWTVEEEFGTIVLANSPDAASAINEIGQLQPGQLGIALVPPAALGQLLGPLGLTAADGPRALIEGYIALLGTDQFDPPQEFTAGDKTVIGARGTVDGESQALYAVDLGGALSLAAVVTAPGEEGQYDDLFRRIIASITYDAPAAPTETGSVVWQQQRPISEEVVEAGAYTDLVSVAVGPDDTVYVADSLAGLHVFAPDGTEQPPAASQASGITFLVSMDIGPDGRLWALDGFFDARVIALNADGTVGEAIPLQGVELNLFGTRLAVGPDGNFYVLNPSENDGTDAVTGTMLVFDASGVQVNSFPVGQSDYFYEAAIDFGPDGNLYVAENFGAPGIKVFAPDGTLLQEGLAAGVLFSGTVALAIAPDGSIFAAVPQSPVFHISAEGALLGSFGVSQFSVADISFDMESFPEFEPGVFYEIRGLAALSNGDVIVIDNNPSFAQIVRLSFSP